jgi:hypothetical protein
MMPTISMFYGILVSMFFKEELDADWELAIAGEKPFPIAPLR